MRKKLLVGIASLLASSLAFAQTSFQQLDEDGDKNISQAEAEAEKDLATNFSQWDQDNDSVLSQDEFKAWQQAEKAERAGGGQQQQKPQQQKPPGQQQ